jgi:hypothetical protein
MSIGQYARELIIASPSASNQEILDQVKARFTEAKTSLACIAWYKSNMKKNGTKQSAPAQRTLELVEDEIVQTKLKLASLEEEYKEMLEADRANAMAMIEELANKYGKKVVDAEEQQEEEEEQQ